ncbi:flavin monoamine oxidase family protein [Psychrobacter sp. DM4]|uniref:flavin monoamine oxidase family protein n=1 Tax=Psychrobacter sp. DM4 TaxID=3440637 RepID=UPI003F509EAB
MLVERSHHEPAVRTLGFKSSPPSMRIVGGMTALIDALYSRLDAKRVVTNQSVKSVSYADSSVEIISEDASGQVTIWHTKQVLLALPPRLVEASITFEPNLPTDLSEEWRNTVTWMAPHAKYFAVYDSPFWRGQGLSGAARSSQGPMVEIHDASITAGSGALFGFIGVPASVRQSVSTEVLKDHCRAQLVRLFGEQAAAPKCEYLKDWSQDLFTATIADVSSNGQHALAPRSKSASGVWSGCLTGIGSEWSPQFSGYLAGAIEAATLGVQSLPK